jgi:hypothetical protein
VSVARRSSAALRRCGAGRSLASKSDGFGNLAGIRQAQLRLAKAARDAGLLENERSVTFWPGTVVEGAFSI